MNLLDSVKALISPKVDEKLPKKLIYPQHTWIKIPKEVGLSDIGTLNSDNRRSHSNRSLSIKGLLWFSKEILAQFAVTDEYYSEAYAGCKKAQTTNPRTSIHN